MFSSVWLPFAGGDRADRGRDRVLRDGSFRAAERVHGKEGDEERRDMYGGGTGGAGGAALQVIHYAPVINYLPVINY